MELTKEDRGELDKIDREAAEGLAELGDEVSIESKDELEAWASVLVDVVGRKNVLKEMETRITKPMNEALKAVRELFNPARSKVEGMERRIKGAMDRYRDESARKVVAAREALKGATGGADQTEALRAIAEADDTEDTSGATSTRKVWGFTVIDIDSVPSEYLTLNETAINAAIRDGVRAIPGLAIAQATRTVMRRKPSAK